MKIVGISFIMLSSVILSKEISGFYARKTKYLTTLRGIIADILSVITFAPKDIYFLLKSYSHERFYPFDGMFSECAENCGEIEKVMKRHLSDIREIDGEISSMLITSFEELTTSSREGAIAHLELLSERLGEMCRKEQGECDKKGKMYSVLSVVFGLTVCVMFF